jgi:hypothetical protein
MQEYFYKRKPGTENNPGLLWRDGKISAYAYQQSFFRGE